MSIVSINFKLKSEEKSSLQQFSTVAEGVRFIQSLDQEQCEYISLTDGYGYQVVGVKNIMKVYRKNDDLYAGKKYCLHPDTDSAPGGGVKCPACSAWFCY